MTHTRPQRSGVIRPKQLLHLDGGLNMLDWSNVRPNEHVSGRNWLRDRDAVVRRRPGNRKWRDAFGANWQGLWAYNRSDGENRLIANIDGKIKTSGLGPDQLFTDLVTGLNTSVRGWLEVVQDQWWWCNRKDTPRLGRLSAAGFAPVRIGIAPPAAAPTVSLGGTTCTLADSAIVTGAIPAEDHYYRYTYVREGAYESNPSAESTKVTNTAANTVNKVNVVASTDTQVDAIYIYRRSSVSVPEDKLVAKVGPATQEYCDYFSAAQLGAVAFWEVSGGFEDHGYPPITIFALELHGDGRLYAWGPGSRLHYTRVLNFYAWPGAEGGRSGVVLIVNEDDGDEGQALISESDDLLALKHYNVYRLVGDGPSTDDGTLGGWKVEKVATRKGCAAPLSAVRGPAGTFWLSDVGPVRVDDRVGLPVEVGRKIRPWVDRSSDLTKGVGWVHGFYYWLFLPFGENTWEGQILDARNGSWWRMTEMHAEAFAQTEDGRLLWGGALEKSRPSKGFLYEWDALTSDDGAVVTAEMTTALVDPSPGDHKLFSASLEHEAASGQTLTTRLIPDQTGSYVQRVVKLVGGIGQRLVTYLPGTKRLQGKALQLYLSANTALARSAVYGWQPMARLLPRALVTQVAVFADAVGDPAINPGALTPDAALLDSHDHVL